MIIRQNVKCQTCDHIHTLRIAIGMPGEQRHTFQCLSCGEDMQIALQIGSGTISELTWINAEVATDKEQHSIVNLDPNFTLPHNMPNEDFSIHRIIQMKAMLQEALKHQNLEQLFRSQGRTGHAIHDIPNHWQALKKTIRLSSRGKTKLAARLLESWSSEISREDPFTSIDDWAFRFCTLLIFPRHKNTFEACLKEVYRIIDAQNPVDFLNYYKGDLIKKRIENYIDIINDFINAYTEIVQIIPMQRMGANTPSNHITTSNDFDAVKTFYGNSYEILSGHAELFTMLNNIDQGRPYDKLESINLTQYRKLDNASKYNAFDKNSAFKAVCVEKDNQIRNASHHKGIRLSEDKITVIYNSGKGGLGDNQTLLYSEFLIKCYNIFSQIIILFCIDLALSRHINSKLF